MTGARIFVAHCVSAARRIVHRLDGPADPRVPGARLGVDGACAHSHLFFFYPGVRHPGAGRLLSARRSSSRDLYWRHLPYGKLRFLLGPSWSAGISLRRRQVARQRAARHLGGRRPTRLLADKGEPRAAQGPRAGVRRSCRRSTDLREEGQSRLGLSKFARSCTVDPMLEAAGGDEQGALLLPRRTPCSRGAACCEAQKRFAPRSSRLQADPATRSLSGSLRP